MYICVTNVQMSNTLLIEKEKLCRPDQWCIKKKTYWNTDSSQEVEKDLSVLQHQAPPVVSTFFFHSVDLVKNSFSSRIVYQSTTGYLSVITVLSEKGKPCLFLLINVPLQRSEDRNDTSLPGEIIK